MGCQYALYASQPEWNLLMEISPLFNFNQGGYHILKCFNFACVWDACKSVLKCKLAQDGSQVWCHTYISQFMPTSKIKKINNLLIIWPCTQHVPCTKKASYFVIVLYYWPLKWNTGYICVLLLFALILVFGGFSYGLFSRTSGAWSMMMLSLAKALGG